MSIHCVTSVLIAIMRGDATIGAWFRQLPTPAAVSTVALGELLFGARISNRPVENEAKVYSLVADFDLIDFDKRCAVAYAEIRAAVRKKGRPCGEADIAIAATAIAQGGTVATLNRKHFEPIPGLTLVDWTMPQ